MTNIVTPDVAWSIRNDKQNVVHRCKTQSSSTTPKVRSCSTRDTQTASIQYTNDTTNSQEQLSDDVTPPNLPSWTTFFSSLIFSCCNLTSNPDLDFAAVPITTEDVNKSTTSSTPTNHRVVEDFKRKKAAAVRVNAPTVVQVKSKDQCLATQSDAQSYGDCLGMITQVINNTVVNATIVCLSVDGQKLVSTFLARVTFPDSDRISILPCSYPARYQHHRVVNLNNIPSRLAAFSRFRTLVKQSAATLYHRLCSRRPTSFTREQPCSSRDLTPNSFSLPSTQRSLTLKKEEDFSSQSNLPLKIPSVGADRMKVLPLSFLDSISLITEDASDRHIVSLKFLPPHQQDSELLSLSLEFQLPSRSSSLLSVLTDFDHQKCGGSQSSASLGLCTTPQQPLERNGSEITDQASTRLPTDEWSEQRMESQFSEDGMQGTTQDKSDHLVGMQDMPAVTGTTAIRITTGINSQTNKTDLLQQASCDVNQNRKEATVEKSTREALIEEQASSESPLHPIESPSLDSMSHMEHLSVVKDDPVKRGVVHDHQSQASSPAATEFALSVCASQGPSVGNYSSDLLEKPVQKPKTHLRTQTGDCDLFCSSPITRMATTGGQTTSSTAHMQARSATHSRTSSQASFNPRIGARSIAPSQSGEGRGCSAAEVVRRFYRPLAHSAQAVIEAEWERREKQDREEMEREYHDARETPSDLLELD